MDQKKFTLGVIGGGVMARAIVCGAADKGVLSRGEICVCEPNEAKRAAFASEGFGTATEARQLSGVCEYLLFAVKPQVFPEVASVLKGAKLPVLISIMAGKTKRSIKETLGADVPVARVMPNLPCSVGEGMAGVDAEGLSGKERTFVLGLFSAVGGVAEVSEDLLNAVTGISGSGPAYVYLFLQSLVKAGVEQGLPKSRRSFLPCRRSRAVRHMPSSREKHTKNSLRRSRRRAAPQ